MEGRLEEPSGKFYVSAAINSARGSTKVNSEEFRMLPQGPDKVGRPRQLRCAFIWMERNDKQSVPADE